MKVTFPYWGNYTIAFKALFQGLGMDVVVPEKTNSETIKKGARIAPDMYCFPLKINLGNYISAIERGADTIFMATSLNGSCRLRYYADIQNKVLKDAGYKVDFIIFDQRPLDVYHQIRKLVKVSFWQIVRATILFFKKLTLIESIEKKINYLRPREKRKRETSEVLKWAMEEIDKAKNIREVFKVEREIKKRISKIEIEKKDAPNVGIIGEIFIITDNSVNFNIEEKLGKEGIEAHREMNATYQIKKKIFPWKDKRIQRGINVHLKSTVGGHGRDAVYEIMDYVKKDFDGIIHLLPFGCMPEVSVRPIIEKIHKESGIPLLSLSLDEQVAEAGVDTRIEAFVDVVKNHYNKKKKK